MREKEKEKERKRRGTEKFWVWLKINDHEPWNIYAIAYIHPADQDTWHIIFHTSLKSIKQRRKFSSWLSLESSLIYAYKWVYIYIYIYMLKRYICSESDSMIESESDSMVESWIN